MAAQGGIHLLPWRSDPGIGFAEYRKGTVGSGYVDPSRQGSLGRLEPYRGYSFSAMRDVFGRPRPGSSTRRGVPSNPRFGQRTSGGFMRGPVASQATAQRSKKLWNYSFAGMAPKTSTVGRFMGQFRKQPDWAFSRTL